MAYMRFLLTTALPFVAILCPIQAQGLRRLRKTALRVPDLNPILATQQQNNENRDAGFELIQHDELEELFFNEVFRLDASMSMSFVDDVRSDDGGGGGGGGGGSSSSNVIGVVGSDNNVVTGGGGGDGSSIYQKCGITASERRNQLLDILSEVSDRSMLLDMSTSQYNARYWLDSEDDAMICTDNSARVKQRYRAGLLYFQFGGDNWDNCRAQGGACFQEDSTSVPAIRFLDGSNECLWFGLSCAGVIREALPLDNDEISPDEYRPIVKVDISDNGLQGDLFHELFGLTELQELTLDGNKRISGTIPEAIGQLTNLVALDIDDNSLQGKIPNSLYSLTTLEAIDLNSNSLTGSVSNDIGNLKNLVVLQLDSNDLDGAMPTDGLFQLEKLAVWTVLDNAITGSTERVCDVLDERRVTNDFPGYLQFFWVDCLGNPPQVECSCCECTEPMSPTSF
ncbi:receptor-like protein kinase [Seminavis robusta]|uniref:Receptor-like protein kinase n=1 Tax=Seminavis robusta TaxID=568900 RepID=A0A9N8F1K2_9STRA|nr:receptor-like protein kinase [Seminavis robusta]|eukprot:Sro2610_g332530.1 receptor-like protein kinase (453) ;mRNA; f:10255-11710